MAGALSDGAITPGHVDALTRATRSVGNAATTALLGDDEALAEAAANRSIVPPTAPADPFERKQHLEALALADVMLGGAPSRSSAGPPSVVVDASQTDGARGPVIDWGIPVELPLSVLRDVFDVHDPSVVIVANGVVLHAPGRTGLGRTTRLANRAQRRALQGLYSTCAVPGCAVHYDRCKLHHVVWWRNGGRTDLANLLPVCQHHHTRIHEDGWRITLGANRELTIQLPGGQVLRNGPPRRSAASRGREHDERNPLRPPRSTTPSTHPVGVVAGLGNGLTIPPSVERVVEGTEPALASVVAGANETSIELHPGPSFRPQLPDPERLNLPPSGRLQR